MITTIDSRNFCDAFNKIESLLKKATFVAIDFEFFGLPKHLQQQYQPSLSDTPDKRYIKLAKGVKSFPPCQMGLTLFMEKDDGKAYDVHPYRMYLYKHTSLIDDGNDGVNFCNSQELERYKKLLISDFPDFSFLGDSFTTKLETLKIELEGKMDLCSSPPELDSSTFSRNLSSSQLSIRQHSALVVNNNSELEYSSGVVYTYFLTGEVTVASSYDSKHVLWNEPLSQLEINAVLYDLTLRYPWYTFNIEDGYKLKAMHVQTKAGYDSRVAIARNNLLYSISGASNIIEALSKTTNLPIVLHNSSLDIFYLYEYFVEPLPMVYETAKRYINFTFPSIIDTKFLSMICSSVFKNDCHRLHGYDLKYLKKYFDSKNSLNKKISGLSLMNIDIHLFSKISRKKIKTATKYHDAGNDSMITGEVFLRLASCYVLSIQSNISNMSISSLKPLNYRFRDLMYIMRPAVVNKIPLAFISTPFMNLAGQDPEPFELYHILLRKKRFHFDGVNGSNLIMNWIKNQFLKISKDDFDMVNEQIKHELSMISMTAKNKYEIKIKEDGNRIEICSLSHDVHSEILRIFGNNRSNTFEICDSCKAFAIYGNTLNEKKSFFGSLFKNNSLGATAYVISCVSLIAGISIIASISNNWSPLSIK
ncbi:Poly(A)-specific ribonuclease PARN [Strongyloides ratti]|uniref:Poly(A)-specific ribonuclease PARN n=1 Tax=Strongyloides ratti TaxID=34506 RepID=A0A090L8B5_STRRB|nr:Poly(A)-specific ribonuclease PARN [Strongyloides ratti]CEF63695.1 Poly(A)-specific ribonuclease PARN [Strongyloides ratti]